MGGAWGLKLFQSDYDYSIIQGLNQIARLHDLERKHGKKSRWEMGTNETRMKEHELANKENSRDIIFGILPGTGRVNGEINYSVYSGLCTHPDIVRKHLDTGVFRTMFETIHNIVLLSSKAEIANADGPGYDLVLLGATLTAANKDILRTLYPRCGLMRDALSQMKEALDPHTGYKNGTPWDFGSLSMRDIHIKNEVKTEDLLFPGTGLYNTLAPVPYDDDVMASLNTMFLQQISKMEVSATDLATGFASLKLSPNTTEKKKVKVFDEKACAGCGKEIDPEKKAFMVCGKCGKCSYCSKECQKAHWIMVHKKECKV